jgi:quinol monooxygenase YgiN
MRINKKGVSTLGLIIIVQTFIFCTSAFAQEKRQIVQMAKLVIDSAQLEKYRAALKEGIETALDAELGVLLLNAVYERNNPTHVIVLEVYANDSAYKAHLQTPHFNKYKTGTKDMVQSLELIEVIPIGLASKLK